MRVTVSCCARMLQVVVVNTDEQMSRRVFQTLLSEIRTRLTRSQNRSKNVAKNVWEAYEDLIGIRDIRRTHQSVLSVSPFSAPAGVSLLNGLR